MNECVGVCHNRTPHPDRLRYCDNLWHKERVQQLSPIGQILSAYSDSFSPNLGWYFFPKVLANALTSVSVEWSKIASRQLLTAIWKSMWAFQRYRDRQSGSIPSLKIRGLAFPRNYTLWMSAEPSTIPSRRLLTAIGTSFTSFWKLPMSTASLDPFPEFWGLTFPPNYTFLNRGRTVEDS
jgi:hypothetical protein